MGSDPDSTSHPDPVLRVKRKHNEDPIDAFVYRMGSSGSKRRVETKSLDLGMFRFAQTVPQSNVPKQNGRFIDAEWDEKHRKISIKRKRDDPTNSETREKALAGSPRKMELFADMLADYLQCTSNSYSVNTIEKKRKIEDEFVYDIYYRERMPAEWQLPKPVSSTRSGPPQIGRAGVTPKSSYSPVPLHKTSQYTSTSAPGFEHLAQLNNHEPAPGLGFDQWEEEDFIPIFIKHTMDEAGHTTIMPISSTGERLAEKLLINEEVQASPSTFEEDEDSNDEDFYGNDYPDNDEWDEGSDIYF